MTIDTDSLIRLIAATAAFGLVLSLWVLIIWAIALRKRLQRQRLEQRIDDQQRSTDSARVLRLWHEDKEVITEVDDQDRPSMWMRLEQMRRGAGFALPLQTLLLGVGGAACLAATFALASTQSPIAAVGCAAAVCMIFWVVVKRRITNRAAIFDRQLLDALELAARSLRAGHPLGGAFQLIAEEVPAPVGTAFAEICKQEDLGVSHEQSMRRVAESTNNEDMKLFTIAVAIQLRSGGNPADLMERLAAVIRDRMRLSRRVRVLTAQTQFSKNILLALPFVMFLALNLLNPEYMSTLYHTPGGRTLLLIGGVSLVVGAWVMNKIAQIRY